MKDFLGGFWSLFEAFTGVKLASLVFAFIGVALGISYTPQITRRMAIAALGAGITCGSLGPELVAAWVGHPLPPAINNALAVCIGIGGMFIVPGVIVMWSEFGKNPLAAIARMFGPKGGSR